MFKTAICTIIKDEHQYLEEWIKYHLNIGFDEIWIYEDYNSSSHLDITSKYPNKVFLNRLEDIKSELKEVRCRGNKQKKTWTYFMEMYRPRFDYVAYIDVDEFITFETGYNLQKLLEEFDGCGGIYLFWKMFNANGIIDNPKTDVVTTFTQECGQLKKNSEPQWTLKTICDIRMRNQEFLTNHEALIGVTTDRLRTLKVRCYKKAWINHYFTRSWEEWCNRFIIRGDIISGNRKLDEFFELNPDMLDMKNELMEKYKEYEEKYKNNLKE